MTRARKKGGKNIKPTKKPKAKSVPRAPNFLPRGKGVADLKGNQLEQVILKTTKYIEKNQRLRDRSSKTLNALLKKKYGRVFSDVRVKNDAQIQAFIRNAHLTKSRAEREQRKRTGEPQPANVPSQPSATPQESESSGEKVVVPQLVIQ